MDGFTEINTAKIRKHFRRFLTFFYSVLLFSTLILPSLAYADPLGEKIMEGILSGKKYTEASLLLMTRDLGWYKQNMHKLKPGVIAEAEAIRVHLASQSAVRAAEKLGEPKDFFGATGSWKAGSDMDVIYLGQHIDEARAALDEAYLNEAKSLLSKNVNADEILREIGDIEVPSSLSADTMSVVTSNLPDYGFDDLSKAWEEAQEAAKQGESQDQIMRRFYEKVQEALGKNVDSHIASTAKDMYRGATGQVWFRENYLEDPKKFKIFVFNETTKRWTVIEGGITMIPKQIAARIGFGKFLGRGMKFTNTASNMMLFYEHFKGKTAKEGAVETSKYVIRVWQELEAFDFSILKDLSRDDMRLITVSMLVAKNPKDIERYLGQAGLSLSDFQERLGGMLYKWTERILIDDTGRLVDELKRLAGTSDSLEKKMQATLLKMEFNELGSGLQSLHGAPADVKNKLVEALKREFDNSNEGRAAINYIMTQLRLLSDEGSEVTRRILKMLAAMDLHNKDEIEKALAKLKANEEIPGELGKKVRQARKEVMLIASGGMLEFEWGEEYLDLLMENWRKARGGRALLTSSSKELIVFGEEFRRKNLADLKKIGWREDELKLPASIRKKLPLTPEEMKVFAARYARKLAKAEIQLPELTSKMRMLIYSPEYLQLGDADAKIGAFDLFIGVAAGLYQTYSIMFNERMSPEDESLAIGNAWVTAIPVVGDFAQGLITGSEGYWEGDKGKMLDAGLWIALVGCGLIPGGQLPAVIGSMMLALKPLATNIYDARQAQNLVQTWIESGNWSSSKPPSLNGIYDRNGLLHRINYDEILGSKGEVKYDSKRLKSTVFNEVTIAESVRSYAKQYILAGNKEIDVLHENLKTLFPDLNDRVLSDLSYAEIKITEKKSKLGMMFFKAYQHRLKGVYIQTINHLKKWADDEHRVAKDYDGEVKRLRDELAALEKELKNAPLVKHADDTVESYSKIVTNLFEQESLPLSKVRIYENYILTYKQIQKKLQSVSQYFNEISSKFVPSSWFLTGYPVFDKDITDRLAGFMVRERTKAAEQVVQLLKDLDQKDASLNFQNECHKKTFNIVAAKRYKIAFMQHLSEYFQALSDDKSRWSDAYESARASYESTRDELLKERAPRDVVESSSYVNAFTTFFFAMGFAIASNDADTYRQVAGDYTAQLTAARTHDKIEREAGTESEAGKILQQCLNIGVKIDIQLSNIQPDAGAEIDATARLIKGSLPKSTYWAWGSTGGLALKPQFGEKTKVKVEADGELNLRLMDDRYINKPVAEAKIKIIPKAVSIRISIRGPREGEIGKQITFVADASVSGISANNIIYEWTIDRQAVSQEREISRVFNEARSFGLRVNAYRMLGSKKVLLDTAEISFTASDSKLGKDDAEKLKERERIEKEQREQAEAELERKRITEQAERERILSEEQKLKAKSACTYKYSEWGNCNGAAKKQTRTVIGKDPYGCIEKDKPVLEQTCSLPPKALSRLTEQEKNALFSCLCQQCSCGGPGCTYIAPTDKDIGGVLACPRVGKPPCLWGEWGCNYAYLKTSGDCVKNCYNGNNVIYDSVQSEKDIRAENRKHTKPLKVSLSPDAKPIKAQYGSVINLSATAEGGIPSYTYAWSGQGTGKDSGFVFINTRKAGTYNVSVTVNDSDGSSATAGTTIVVESLTVKLEKIKPDGNNVTLGGAAQFRATAMSGNQPASGDFTMRWEPYQYKIAAFKERETKGGSATNEITFLAPGTYPVYVDLLQKQDNRLASVGESSQISIQVVAPKWKLEFTPQDPLVGQSVKAKIMPDTGTLLDTKEVKFRWQMPVNTKQTATSQDDSEITFKLIDTKPANVSCIASTKSNNDSIGGAGKTITAKGYKVAIAGPNPLQKLPPMWKCETQLGGAQSCGMKEVASQFGVDQQIRFSAAVEPKPEKQANYNWSISPEGCTLNSNGGSDTSISCRSTGSYTTKVDVKSDGMAIGSAAAGVNISISQDDFKKSNKSKEAYEKLQKAKELVSQGKLDEGINLADDASKSDPKNTEAANYAKQLKSERERVLQQLEKTNKLIGESRFTEAQNELNVAKNLHGKYARVIETEQKLAGAKAKSQASMTLALKLREEGKKLQNQGKLQEAISKYKESIKLVPDQGLQKHISELEKKIAEDQKKSQLAMQARSQGEAFQKQNKIPEAIAKYKEYLGLAPNDQAMVKHVSDLEAKYKEQQQKARDQQQKTQQAAQARSQGEALQKQNKIPEAIAKYKEYLTYQPDDQAMKNHVKALETSMTKVGASTPETGRKYTSKPIATSLPQKNTVIFDNGNISGVMNNPTGPTTFSINQPHHIKLIRNYHWNNGKGASPGVISLKDQSGRVYGPWKVKGSPTQGSSQNIYWDCYPETSIPAGTYTVIDSNPSTWSQNSGSNGKGMTRIEVLP